MFGLVVVPANTPARELRGEPLAWSCVAAARHSFWRLTWTRSSMWPRRAARRVPAGCR